jgi:bifunctional DNA-binding transcriptional regulator/antitoxin component of YhaV-PrlF toxin-antitoxin module
MKVKNVTITSKNQITLPAELVRKMKLDKSRRLTIRQRGDELVLKPEPTLQAILEEVWRQLPPLPQLRSDEEFQRIAHEAWNEKEL